MKTFKPKEALLTESQMQEVKEQYLRHKAEFWDQVTELEFIHTNNPYDSFVRIHFRDGCVSLCEMVYRKDPKAQSELMDREVLGSTSFHGD